MSEWIELDREWIGNEDDDEDDPANWKTIRIPARYIVCPTCEGGGTNRSAHLGAFTSEDMDDLDEDFISAYFSGAFDRKCEECDGLRVVLVADKDAADPELYAEWERRQLENEELEYSVRMEQRYLGDL